MGFAQFFIISNVASSTALETAGIFKAIAAERKTTVFFFHIEHPIE